MKILRLINAILYIFAILFIILELILKKEIYKIYWILFMGGASILLLVVSIIQLKRKRK